uniref:Piezo-type mechanosensitive ion channel component n=1 Tax=Trichuris muris TaxID=70415 RepID=A0A5S6R6C3_TRIMR
MQRFEFCYAFVLPVALLIGALLRPCLLSLLYGIYLLLWPLFASGCKQGASGSTFRFVVVCFLYSSLALLSQVCYHVVLTVSSLDAQLVTCHGWEPILSLLGFQKVQGGGVVEYVRFFLPDILVFTVTLCSIVLARMSARVPANDESPELPMHSLNSKPHSPGSPQPREATSRRNTSLIVPDTLDFRSCMPQLILGLLFCSIAVIFPCMWTLPYFVFFLLLMTLWSVYKVPSPGAARTLVVLLLLYSSVNLVALYLYQLWPLQTQIPPEDLAARLLGFKAYINATCTEAPGLHFAGGVSWSAYAYPVLVFAFYLSLAFQSFLVSVPVKRSSLSPSRCTSTESLISESPSAKEDAGPFMHKAMDRPTAYSIETAEISKSDVAPSWCKCCALLNTGYAKIFPFLLRNFYAVSLVIMMTWAVLYHSWLSFVWLVIACIVWMRRDSRRAFFCFSPLILFYAEALLLLQFIYGLELTEAELPDEMSGVPLKQIGLVKPAQAAVVPLFVKMLFTLSFWATLRLLLYEKKRNREESELDTSAGYGTFSQRDNSKEKHNILEQILSKYWIYVVSLVLMIISIRQPVFAYNIIYMAFFLSLISVMLISFSAWKNMLFLYWLILAAYSICVLLFIYTFQFHGVPELWKSWTSWSNETFVDVGLITYDSGSLFLQLLTPISFLIVVILQLKFFHAGFMRITNPLHRSVVTQPSQQQSRMEGESNHSRINAFLVSMKACRDVAWRFLEIHITKLVAFFVFFVAVAEVSAVNALFPIFAIFILTFRHVRSLLCFVVCILAAAIALAKMLFQLHFAKVATIPISEWNCSMEFGENSSHSVDAALWAGFSKTNSISSYLENYIWLFILMAFQVIVFQRQIYKRAVKNASAPPDGVLFEGVTRKEADRSVTDCLMYLVNHGFYKFGVEVVFIVMTIDIAIRMDSFAFVYCILLLILVSLGRRTLAKVWYVFILFLGICIVGQYAFCVGLPPNLCLKYPWHWNANLIQWLFLPDYVHPPNVRFLLADFCVFLVASCQLYVFRVEMQHHDKEYIGGDNTPILDKGDSMASREEGWNENEIPDFITYCMSGLDMIKAAIFKYFHWLTMLAVFAAGVGGISAFAFGYLIAAFGFLWKGNDLYLKPPRSFVSRWRILLYYNIFAMLLKVALQVVGCVFLSEACNASPSLVQLFSVACIHSDIAPRKDADPMIATNCKVASNQAQILYDSICFAFLIFQLRMFNSWYFKHVIVEIKADQIFSARGAVLIDQLIKRKMMQQQKNEDQIVDKVKDKTKRIRQKYLKHMKEGEYFEPHNYAEAKRAGDYYMFDYDSEPEGEDSKLLEEEEEEGHKEDKEVAPSQMIHMALTTDLHLDTIAETAEQAKGEERTLDEIIQEQTEKEKKEKRRGKKYSKFLSCLKFMQALLVSCMNRISNLFNRWSSEHRYVACVLADEKRKLKASLGKELYTHLDADQLQDVINRSEIGQRIYRVPSECSLAKMQDDVETSWVGHSAVRRFITALYYLVVANTDILCYLMIIFNQMFNASVISLPLPFFAFLWGTLCTPRPPKVFWVTLITYLESMIVIKFILQFGFFPWNQLVGSSDPFYPPRILGVEKKADFATLDIALLIVLFFHRHHLKTLGLWRESDNGSVSFDDIDRLKSEGQSLDREPLIVDDVNVNGSYELRSLAKDKGEDQNDTPTEVKSQGMTFRDGIVVYVTPIVTFFRRVLNPPFRYILDLYAWLFLCDFICFLISAFSYTSFGVDTGRGDVMADIQSNKVPLPYVVILIILMLLMVIDRAIYLRKSVIAKLCFQYFLVLGTHVWIFFILPAITGRVSTKNVPAMLWYLVKSVYLLISAVQIRNGYPSRSLSNFLTKHYSFLSYCLFTGYRSVPFLYELRTLIDWIWIETSMPLFDYINMENIFARIYSTKCNRQYEKEYPVPRGTPKTFGVKYGMGLPILLLLITLLWLPLLLFSTVNTIGVRLLPEHSSFRISVAGFPTLYAVEAQGPFIKPLNPVEFEQFYANYSSKHAVSFLREYSPSDTVRAMYRRESDTIWAISAPGKLALYNEATSSADMVLVLEFDFRRPSQGNTETSGVHSFRREVPLRANSEAREALIGVLQGRKDVVPVRKAFPWLVVLPALGPVHPAYSILDSIGGDNLTNSYADLFLHLHVTKDNDTASTQWWEVSMTKPVRSPPGASKEEKDNDQKPLVGLSYGLEVIAFVDRVFPSALSYFTSRGIIGVYLVVVLAAARLIRTLVVTSPLELIINEIPNVDRILRLCLDIFLVREAKDFMLEIDLYAKLIFLLRSPETLIRFTRPKVE